MSPRVAPIARRTPISCVRSVTVASMMFMMPMPPTSNEIQAMYISSRVSRAFCFCNAFSSRIGTMISKSRSSRPALRASLKRGNEGMTRSTESNSTRISDNSTASSFKCPTLRSTFFSPYNALKLDSGMYTLAAIVCPTESGNCANFSIEARSCSTPFT